MQPGNCYAENRYGRGLQPLVAAWAPCALAVSFLLAATAADARPANEPGDDERAVLMATRGHIAPKTAGISRPHSSPPADLDGEALQAWFDQRYGASPRPSPPTQAQPATDVPDDEAEAEVLARIKRRQD